MKNSIKTIAILAVTALMLTGCAENRENSFNGNESNSSVIENSSASANSEAKEPDISTTNSTTTSQTPNYPKPIESSSTATSTVEKTVEKPIEKPASTTSSTTTTVSKPTEKPIATSSTTTTTTASKPIEKPIEKPVHTHNFTNATCEKPAACSCGITKGNALGHNYTSATCNKLATCTICGATKGTYANHNYKNGICAICGENDPNYAAPHNCDKDGHVWKDNGTKTSKETVEIKETHYVVANGFDYDLAYKYFGLTAKDIDFYPYLGTNAFASGSTPVKTTGTKTITTYYHKCTDCGFNEVYNTEETVTPSETWEFVYPQDRPEYYQVVWYNINNIPREVLEGREKEKIAEEEFLNSLL